MFGESQHPSYELWSTVARLIVQELSKGGDGGSDGGDGFNAVLMLGRVILGAGLAMVLWHTGRLGAKTARWAWLASTATACSAWRWLRSERKPDLDLTREVLAVLNAGGPLVRYDPFCGVVRAPGIAIRLKHGSNRYGDIDPAVISGVLSLKNGEHAELPDVWGDLTARDRKLILRACQEVVKRASQESREQRRVAFMEELSTTPLPPVGKKLPMHPCPPANKKGGDEA